MSIRLDTVIGHAKAGHEVTPDQYEPELTIDEQPVDHSISSLMTGFQLSVAAGLGNRIGVDLALPVRVTVLEADFHNDLGDSVEPDSIHHRDEVIAGLGDLELGFRFGLLRPSEVPRLSLDLRVGLSFPTGHVEEDPYVLGAKGIRHVHTFFGQGAFLPQLGLELDFDVPAGHLLLGGDGQLSLYEGEKGYLPPSFGSFWLGFASNYGVPWLTLSVRHVLYVESESFWNGVTAENSGRTDLSFDVATEFALGAGVAVGAMVKGTYATVTNGGDLSSPWLVGLSVSWTRQ